MGMNFLASLILAAALAPQAPPSPRAPDPAPGQAPAAAPRTYVIGPQDELSITVFGEPELTNKFRVENDGFLTFPYLEKIAAAGKTLNELEATITAMLKNGYIANPQVRVEVDQYKSQSVFVTGQVRSPNEYTMTGSSMTLMQALAMAGSPTADASTEVIVSRKSPGGGDNQIIRVNLRDLELGQKDLQLQDGDVINVPKAQTFFVDGYVRNPGSYVLDYGMTVQQAIALAGGLNERGSTRDIKASRLVNGKLVDVDVSLEDLVQPGDTIKIRARFF
jgi:polysaccharide export outer membrane protein